MLVVLSISNRRLCGLQDSPKFNWPRHQNPSTSPQINSHHHPAGHNVAVVRVQRALLLAAGLTLISAESAFPSKPSHVSTWCDQCQPRLSHELQHRARSRALTQVSLAALPRKTFPPTCGTRKIHCCVHITPPPHTHTHRTLIPNLVLGFPSGLCIYRTSGHFTCSSVVVLCYS
jgi:hypothetical protein